VPLFLGTGGHLRRDLPPLVDALRAAHPGRRSAARSDRRAPAGQARRWRARPLAAAGCRVE
jgi:sirohydrochlorin ferrochelatase